MRLAALVCLALASAAAAAPARLIIARGAWASFDGRDGYQRHPRQAAYRHADARTANYRCGARPSPPRGRRFQVLPPHPGKCRSEARSG